MFTPTSAVSATLKYETPVSFTPAAREAKFVREGYERVRAREVPSEEEKPTKKEEVGEAY